MDKKTIRKLKDLKNQERNEALKFKKEIDDLPAMAHPDLYTEKIMGAGSTLYLKLREIEQQRNKIVSRETINEIWVDEKEVK